MKLQNHIRMLKLNIKKNILIRRDHVICFPPCWISGTPSHTCGHLDNALGSAICSNILAVFTVFHVYIEHTIHVFSTIKRLSSFYDRLEIKKPFETKATGSKQSKTLKQELRQTRPKWNMYRSPGENVVNTSKLAKNVYLKIQTYCNRRTCQSEKSIFVVWEIADANQYFWVSNIPRYYAIVSAFINAFIVYQYNNTMIYVAISAKFHLCSTCIF